MLKKFKTNTYYCFSPPVMIATVLIELGLAIYTILRLPKNRVTVLGTTLLVLLAVFQVAEFNICEDIGFVGSIWAKVGFVAITFLPVVGLDMILSVARKRFIAIKILAYSTALLWSGMFLFRNIMQSQFCGGNYIIFNLKPMFGGAYFVYYYLWIFIGSVIAIYYAKKEKRNIRNVLYSIVIGYAAFTVPATIIWLLVDSGAAQGLPSIMCGFAVIMALITGLYTLPKYNTALLKSNSKAQQK